MKTFLEWANSRNRLASEFLRTFKNEQVQVHVLQALMSHEYYRGKSAMEILDLEIPRWLELDVQKHLGLNQPNE